MTTVVFHDPAGRPLAGAVVSIAAAPGEITDIAMIADDRGEISITANELGNYEFAVFNDGVAQNVRVRIDEGDEAVRVEVG